MLRTLALLVALSCAVPTTVASQASNPARAQVVKFVHDYTDANNRVDVNAMLEMTSRNPSVAQVANGEIVRGWDAIRQDNDQMVGKEGSFRISVGSMDISLLGSANALVVAPVTLLIATPSGPREVKGALTMVLEKKGGAWLLLNEHYSINAAGT